MAGWLARLTRKTLRVRFWLVPGPVASEGSPECCALGTAGGVCECRLHCGEGMALQVTLGPPHSEATHPPTAGLAMLVDSYKARFQKMPKLENN